MEREKLVKYFDKFLDSKGMLDYPTPERENLKRAVEIDRERYIGLVLGELEECDNFEEFAANVDALFSYEHDDDQGTNDYIEGAVEKFEDIPNLGEVLRTRAFYTMLAQGAIELFKDHY
jgi:hypothetical protein